MEEQKLNEEKLSYEELNSIAVKLTNENAYLKENLKKLVHEIRSINRIDYLLRIVEINNGATKFHFNDDFISNCINEIEKAMTPASDEKEKNAGSN